MADRKNTKARRLGSGFTDRGADIIRTARIMIGLSQNKLAKVVGVSQQFLSKVELNPDVSSSLLFGLLDRMGFDLILYKRIDPPERKHERRKVNKKHAEELKGFQEEDYE